MLISLLSAQRYVRAVIGNVRPPVSASRSAGGKLWQVQVQGLLVKRKNLREQKLKIKSKVFTRIFLTGKLSRRALMVG